MKKLILTFITVVGFAFASNAQCGSQATQVTTACGSTCYSIEIQLTGILEIDIRNWNATGGTMMRKPTSTELLMFAEASCN